MIIQHCCRVAAVLAPSKNITTYLLTNLT